jgi:hypothetical protein
MKNYKLEVLKVSCPICRSRPGVVCRSMGPNGPNFMRRRGRGRADFHRQRLTAYRRLSAVELLGMLVEEHRV